MEDSAMSLRRLLPGLCLTAILGCIVPAHAQGLGWSQRASQAQHDRSEGSTVSIKKDDSRLTVVQEQTDPSDSIVDVASKSKSKKSSSSLWNRLRHPTQWFSSQKSKKR